MTFPNNLELTPYSCMKPAKSSGWFSGRTWGRVKFWILIIGVSTADKFWETWDTWVWDFSGIFVAVSFVVVLTVWGWGWGWDWDWFNFRYALILLLVTTSLT